jgi:Dam-replacing HTH domain
VKDKIRQQLQVLRDLGRPAFVAPRRGKQEIGNSPPKMPLPGGALMILFLIDSTNVPHLRRFGEFAFIGVIRESDLCVLLRPVAP